MADVSFLREKMVYEQITARGITNSAILEAMRKVARHEFVALELQEKAYGDYPLAIGEGQTISQPFMVATMMQALKLSKEDRVLEIGTGSGYQTALLAELAHQVFTIERLEKLSQKAKGILKKLGYANIHFLVGDGTLGWPAFSPYDAIIITAGCPRMVDELMGQVKINGRMLAPIGNRLEQTLTLFTKKENIVEEERICQCVFVPLVGRYGWN